MGYERIRNKILTVYDWGLGGMEYEYIRLLFVGRGQEGSGLKYWWETRRVRLFRVLFRSIDWGLVGLGGIKV